mgnify:CR=1 FL=1
MEATMKKTWKQSRIASLFAVGLMYFIAIFGGVLTYAFLPAGMSFLLKIFLADVTMTLVIFFFSLITKNASCYDAYWSFIPLVLVIAHVLFLKGISWVHIPFIIAITFWGTRLTLNWIKSFYSFDYIDWRYTMLQKSHPKIWLLTNFFGIHMIPTVVVFLAMLPYIYLIEIPAASFSWWSLIGLAVSIFATILQLVSDRQMAAFRAKPENKGKCVNVGFWKYSRHPNYFGECLMWLGIYLMAVPYAYAIRPIYALYLALGTVAMFALFLGISIPMMEKRQKNKIGYEDYCKQTSVFILAPRRKKNG